MVISQDVRKVLRESLEVESSQMIWEGELEGEWPVVSKYLSEQLTLKGFVDLYRGLSSSEQKSNKLEKIVKKHCERYVVEECQTWEGVLGMIIALLYDYDIPKLFGHNYYDTEWHLQGLVAYHMWKIETTSGIDYVRTSYSEERETTYSQLCDYFDEHQYLPLDYDWGGKFKLANEETQKKVETRNRTRHFSNLCFRNFSLR